MKRIDVSLNSIEGVKNFVNAVSRLDCDVDIVSGRYVIDAKSIMGIFSIDLTKPATVQVHAEGEKAEEALEILRAFQAK